MVLCPSLFCGFRNIERIFVRLELKSQVTIDDKQIHLPMKTQKIDTDIAVADQNAKRWNTDQESETELAKGFSEYRIVKAKV